MTEKHSMKIGMEKPGPTPEQLNALETKRISSTEFEKYEGQIRGLSRNALDAHEGRGLTERQKDVTGLYSKYLEASKRGELFVGLKNDVVVAFLALNKTGDGDHKKAVIDQVRFAAGLRKPGRIIRGVLRDVKASLLHEGIRHAEIEIEGERHKVSSAESPEFKNFFENMDSEDETEGGDAQAENDIFHTPENQVANDNFEVPVDTENPDENIKESA